MMDLLALFKICRIMLEEHGYHRSGKKCREKFENLYKYYKKTKEGKAGRQDGKNYRFFRQLEAIYGGSNNQVREHKLCESISFSISNSSHEFETSSSENNEEYDLTGMASAMGDHSVDLEKKKLQQHIDVDNGHGSKRSRRIGWREKVKAFIDSEMRRLMERQEAWMDSMLKTIERREQERTWREMEWRRQETARFDREHQQWAKERAWIEARDAALMEALKKSSGGNEQLINVSLSLSKAQLLPERGNNIQAGCNTDESETWSLIHLRTSLESSFQECGYLSDGLWEAIASKMTCLGYNLNGAECKEKWENIRASFSKIADDGNRKVD